MSGVAPRILLVDDEELALKSLYFDLQERGYQVSMAQDGESALRQLAAQRFDLLLTDLVMSNMDGLELIAAAKLQQPQLCALVMSGYTDWQSLGESLYRLADDVLFKPCLPSEIHYRIRRNLDLKSRAAISDHHNADTSSAG